MEATARKKPSPKSVTVQTSEQISPSVQRIVLQGEALKTFPADCEGGYIKLLFNADGSVALTPQFEAGQRPSMRTYTIRQFNSDLGMITVDFVRHQCDEQTHGFAAHWAVNAKAGDPLMIAGPGLASDFNLEADWFFMAADLTALPALSCKLKDLPGSAKGYVVIQILDDADRQALAAPEGIELIWTTEANLAEVVRAQIWLDGQVSVWAACEFEQMRALRQYFRNEKQVGREHIYLSSYWKQGVTEDGHKVLKQQDAQDHDSI